MNNILNDLHVPCKCGGRASADTHNLFMCNRCDGVGRVKFRPTCSLFVDQDGVLAGFDEGYHEKHGVFPHQHTDEQMWANINADDQFWYHLPVLPGAVDFLNYVQGLSPKILTACPAENYRDVALAKKYWIRKEMPYNPYVLPVQGAGMKPMFMHNIGDILIDDFAKNIERWETHGGIGILHRGNFEETKESLRTILRSKHLNRH